MSKLKFGTITYMVFLLTHDGGPVALRGGGVGVGTDGDCDGGAGGGGGGDDGIVDGGDCCMFII